jgi:mono/diheme cytochrome c family protein
LSALAALCVAFALGNAALVGCGGGSSQSTPTTDTGTSQGGGTTTPSGTPEPGTTTAVADGSQIYAERCALCHGAEGKGDGPASASLNPKPRNHTDGSYMNARSDEELLGVIREGKGAMPAWKSVLSEEEMVAVLKHIRTLASPPYPG